MSKKNTAQTLLPPREKTLSQSCSLAPSTGKTTATTTKTKDRPIPLEAANFVRNPSPLMDVVALRGAVSVVVLCVPWTGFCGARTFQPSAEHYWLSDISALSIFVCQNPTIKYAA